MSTLTPRFGLGLARVTVATPRRRIDVAVPDNTPVAELLPHLLRHAGESVTDNTAAPSGWALRRATGELIDPIRSLSGQGIRDGEILELVPRRTEWPEPAYDDIAEMIAHGSRLTGRSWGPVATRAAGLVVSGAAFAVGLIGIASAGPPWEVAALAGYLTGAALALAGVALSRALGDATAGGFLAGAALPYSALSGFLILAPDDAAVFEPASPAVLFGSASLLVFSVVGYVGTAAVRWLFMAGCVTGLAGLVAGLLWLAGMSAAGSAAITLTVVIGMLPAYPLIATYVGRLPLPELPDRPEDVVKERPMPRREDVFAAVTGASDLLTGMLLSVAIVATVATVVLIRSEDTLGGLLAACASAALLLRSRLFPVPRQRLPLLVSGAAGVAIAGVSSAETPALRVLLTVCAVVVGAAVLASGLVYSRRRPGPYMGRLADWIDVLAIMALAPLAVGVTGLYRHIQSLFASFGG